MEMLCARLTLSSVLMSSAREDTSYLSRASHMSFHIFPMTSSAAISLLSWRRGSVAYILLTVGQRLQLLILPAIFLAGFRPCPRFKDKYGSSVASQLTVERRQNDRVTQITEER